MSDCENILVFARIRPFSVDEEAEKEQVDAATREGHPLLLVDETHHDVISVPSVKGDRRRPYHLNAVLDETKTNHDVSRVVLKVVLQRILEGKNAAILAYGATGAGKTYTMFNSDALETDPKQCGLNYMLVRKLLKKMNNADGPQILGINACVIQIYNEKMYDLLNGKNLELYVNKIRYEDKTAVEEKPVATEEDFIAIVNEAEKRREVCPTSMNANSSRSHVLIKLSINLKCKSGDICSPHIILADLAGSEQASEDLTVKGDTHTTEGRFINKSLLALTKLINKASEGLSEQCLHSISRDSKLSRILGGCIGGNSFTTFVLCISPLPSVIKATVQTLTLGTRLTKIKNPVKVIKAKKNYEQLEQENMKLKDILKHVSEQHPELSQEAERKEIDAELQRKYDELQDEFDALKSKCDDLGTVFSLARNNVTTMCKVTNGLESMRALIECDVPHPITTPIMGSMEIPELVEEEHERISNLLLNKLERLNLSVTTLEKRLRTLEATQQGSKNNAVAEKLGEMLAALKISNDEKMNMLSDSGMADVGTKLKAALVQDSNAVAELETYLMALNNNNKVIEATAELNAKQLDKANTNLRETEASLDKCREMLDMKEKQLLGLEDKMKTLTDERDALETKYTECASLLAQMSLKYKELVAKIPPGDLKDKCLEDLGEANEEKTICISMQVDGEQNEEGITKRLTKSLAHNREQRKVMEQFFSACLKYVAELSKAMHSAFKDIPYADPNFDFRNLYKKDNIVKLHDSITDHWNFIREYKKCQDTLVDTKNRYFVICHDMSVAQLLGTIIKTRGGNEVSVVVCATEDPTQFRKLQKSLALLSERHSIHKYTIVYGDMLKQGEISADMSNELIEAVSLHL